MNITNGNAEISSYVTVKGPLDECFLIPELFLSQEK